MHEVVQIGGTMKSGSWNHKVSQSGARCWLVVVALLASILALGVMQGASAAEIDVSVLHEFSQAEGDIPLAPLVQGADGTLYGSTTRSYSGGTVLFAGAVFKIDPVSRSYQKLHGFSSNLNADGGGTATPLILDDDGTLYGLSTSGFYRISPDGEFQMLKLLGAQPGNDWVRAADGNFYGTTVEGGAANEGTVFKLTPTGELTTLYSFTGGADGSEPTSGLTDGGDGYFYGTTSGGRFTIYRIGPSGEFSTIVTLTGVTRLPGIYRAADGSLYGTAASPQVFAYQYRGEGDVSFWPVTGATNDVSRLVRMSDGALYATAGASAGGSGMVFKLSLAGEVTPVHNFNSTIDGSRPLSSPIEGLDGNLFGTTQAGGGRGNVYRLNQTPVLPEPSNLRATAGDGSIHLQWNAVTDSDYYSIYISDVAGQRWKGPSGTGILDTSLTLQPVPNNATYYITVTANNEAGGSVRSNEVVVTPQPGPTAPSNLTATAGNGQVQLSWSAVSGATSYVVYAGTTSGSLSPIAAGVTSIGYVATELSNGTTYYFQVAASNASVTGARSSQVSATPQAVVPAPPTNLAAEAGDTEVRLSWTAASGATAYAIYAGADSGDLALVRDDLSATNFAMTGLSNGTRYYFQVAAVHPTGTSARTATVSATPAAASVPLPAAPTGLAAFAGDGQVELRWNPVSGATGYVIYAGNAGTSPSQVASGVTATAYTVTSLTNGQPYTFQVAALNAGGPGPASSSVQATPQPPPSDDAPGDGSGGGGAMSLLNLLALAVMGLRGRRFHVGGVTGDKRLSR